ncbi:MAG TPA: hypothetical protein DCL35_03115 [Candidatus Omnitrophica bacterium]|nr:hypothetical protein [Candidatus Omnitrophota bacterium]
MQAQEVSGTSEYPDILIRRRKTIILFFVLTLAAVGMGTVLMTPVYQAKAVLLIDVAGPDVVATTANVAMESQGASYYSYREYYRSQMAIVKSYPIIKQVFDEFGVGKSEKYAKAKDPMKEFLKTIDVQSVRDTRLMDVNVENEDPVIAAKMVNRIADLYIRRNLDYISKSELLNLLKNEYLRLDARLAEYSKIYKEGHPEMIRVREEMADVVASINKEKETGLEGSKAVHDRYKEQLRGALAGLKANNVSVVEYAQDPIEPVKPNKLLNLLLAIVTGLFGGVGLALFFEYQDATIRSVEDIEKLTSWSFLGKVPVIPGSKKEFSTHLKPEDFTSEAYKSIRTQLLLLDTKTHPLKTIVFSSIGPQEGKTLTVCNLAIAIAQSQKRVLLVDADMRRPRLHEVLKVKDGKGLCSFLSEKAALEELVRKTDIENLYFVADPYSCANSTELLSAQKISDFLAFARKNFDYILLDSPPVGIVSDATLLSTLADGLVLVVESGKTPRKAIVRQRKALDGAGIKVAGVIINKAVISGSEGYYYSKSYHRMK